MARDVRMEDVSTMIDKLGNWASTTQVLLATLEVRGAWFRKRKKRRNSTSMCILLPPLSSMRRLFRTREKCAPFAGFANIRETIALL